MQAQKAPFCGLLRPEITIFIESSEDDTDDIVFTGYDKPWLERSPIALSDEETIKDSTKHSSSDHLPKTSGEQKNQQNKKAKRKRETVKCYAENSSSDHLPKTTRQQKNRRNKSLKRSHHQTRCKFSNSGC